MKARKPRVHARQTFRGTLEHDELSVGQARLSVRRGAYRRTTDSEGGMLADTFEAAAVCWANVGDKLLLTGPNLDEIAMAQVVTIYPSGDRMQVVLTEGQIAPTTRDVYVLPTKLGKRRAQR